MPIIRVVGYFRSLNAVLKIIQPSLNLVRHLTCVNLRIFAIRHENVFFTILSADYFGACHNAPVSGPAFAQ